MSTFTRLLLAELPFMLNLPSGDYDVQLATQSVRLVLAQEYCAVPGAGGSFQLVPTSQAPAYSRSAMTELRTLVQHQSTTSCAASELPIPSLDDIINHLAGEQVRAGTPLQGEELLNEMRSRFEALDTQQKQELTDWVAKKLFARKAHSAAGHQTFLGAVNQLVRHYMVEFGDPFAEEVVLHHLASTWTRGVMEIHQCDNVLLESFHVAGKIPPIIRRPWVLHPPTRIDNFRSTLSSQPEVDPVNLLGIRARSLLERGATRSAIVEASAGLEAAVARRLRSGLLSAGLPEADVDAKLRATQRFSDRCKSLMRKAVGKSLPEADLALWGRVVAHRDNYRHKITHDDSEPEGDVARQAVDDLVALAKLVRTL